MASIQDKIKEIDEKILELNKVYHEDIGASYREAVQTQDMINMLKKQKNELQKDSEMEIIPSKRFILKSDDGETIIFNVVSSNPDRSNNEISIHSIIGDQLINSNSNDIILFKGKEYQITIVE